MAPAAILEHGRRELLESRLVRNSSLGGLDILGEFNEAGLEVRLVLPDPGNAAVPPPVLLLSGNKAADFVAPSLSVCRDSFTVARSNGILPFDMSNSFFAAWPSCSMSARLSAIGSVSAKTAVTPQARTNATATKRS